MYGACIYDAIFFGNGRTDGRTNKAILGVGLAMNTLQTFLSNIFIQLHIYIQENVATLCVVLTNYNTLNTCFVSVWKTTFFSLVSLTMEITGIN